MLPIQYLLNCKHFIWSKQKIPHLGWTRCYFCKRPAQVVAVLASTERHKWKHQEHGVKLP